MYLLALAAAALLTQAPAAQADLPLPLSKDVWTTPGAHLPDLELPRVDGQGLVRLSDYEGKKLLLIQFASW